MKLYKISRIDDVNYWEYSCFVVAAKDKKSALECIGESNSLVEKVILSSFNAG